MITHILGRRCMLAVNEDISYKLVSIKKAQINRNQHTPVKLIDFVSVLVMNKREDNDRFNSSIVFNHNYILKFLETHK